MVPSRQNHCFLTGDGGQVLIVVYNRKYNMYEYWVLYVLYVLYIGIIGIIGIISAVITETLSSIYNPWFSTTYCIITMLR